MLERVIAWLGLYRFRYVRARRLLARGGVWMLYRTEEFGGWGWRRTRERWVWRRSPWPLGSRLPTPTESSVLVTVIAHEFVGRALSGGERQLMRLRLAGGGEREVLVHGRWKPARPWIDDMVRANQTRSP